MMHEKIIGLLFACLAAKLISSEASVLDWIRWNVLGDLFSYGPSWCALGAVVLGLVQLFTSSFLAFKENFMRIWSGVNFAISMGYAVLFAVKLELKGTEPLKVLNSNNRIHFDEYLLLNFVLLFAITVNYFIRQVVGY